MPRLIKKRSRKAGLPPGTLVHIGEKKVEKAKITGIYGMNFKYMPELERWWGYPAVLLIMLAIGVLMLIYFRKKKWI